MTNVTLINEELLYINVTVNCINFESMTNVTLINEELLYINVAVNCINFESMTNVTLINGFEFQIPGGAHRIQEGVPPWSHLQVKC